MRTLPSGYGIKLDFFHDCRSRCLTIEDIIGKSGPLEIFLKITYRRPQIAFVLVKSLNSVEDVRAHPFSEMSCVGQEWHIGSYGG
jgi:hypothetical protein